MMRSAILTLALAFALTACGSDTSEPEEVVTPIATETPTEPPASSLVSFGYAESVTWAPTADLAGELSISVDRVREGDFADFDGLEGSGITEANRPFYVDVVIANEGDADFGGLDVPLYLQDSNGTLSPPWGFAEPFKPCDSGPLPTPFGAGEEADMCLVFFGSPAAQFASVTFRPSTETAAVLWTGDLTVEKPAKKAKKSAGKRR